MSDHPPFNPLDKGILGESVGGALLACTLHPLAEIESFKGAGIYAIYYTGSFAAYSAITVTKVRGQDWENLVGN